MREKNTDEEKVEFKKNLKESVKGMYKKLK